MKRVIGGQINSTSPWSQNHHHHHQQQHQRVVPASNDDNSLSSSSLYDDYQVLRSPQESVAAAASPTNSVTGIHNNNNNNSNSSEGEEMCDGVTSSKKPKRSSLVVPQPTQQNDDEMKPSSQTTNLARLVTIEAEIDKTFGVYQQLLSERKEYLLKELNTVAQYAMLSRAQELAKQLQIQYQLDVQKQKIENELRADYAMHEEYSKKLDELRVKQNRASGGSGLLDAHENDESVSLVNELLGKIEADLRCKLDALNEVTRVASANRQLIDKCRSTDPLASIEFVSNFAAIQTSIRNTFGFIRINQQQQQSTNKQINVDDGTTYPNRSSPSDSSRMVTSSSSNSSSQLVANTSDNEAESSLMTTTDSNAAAAAPPNLQIDERLLSYTEFVPRSQSHQLSSNKSNIKDLTPEHSCQYLGSQPSQQQQQQFLKVNQLSKISLSTTTVNVNSLKSSSSSSGLVTTTRRAKMIYNCKFGEFGVHDGQFTEPSGVTMSTTTNNNGEDEIIVADTNSHRIQIFDAKTGAFKFKFGECGKRDGQLLYPNRVAVVKSTGDIVVTERAPTHQIQIFNKHGKFVRKFGANILQHPRGLYVDYKSRIVVVECKIMRVIIFDLNGNVLGKFDCSKYLEFPNGVCCSDPTASGGEQLGEEIYISDNRAHCVKVFDYQGNYLRQIGGEGITNYPIGVGINANNEIMVVDNHNNFNLTVFAAADGRLLNALESKVKHAQCFDVGIMDDGQIVLASKDYHVYVYKYAATTSSGSKDSTNTTSLQVGANNKFRQLDDTSNSAAAAATAVATNTAIPNFGYELFGQNHSSISNINFLNAVGNAETSTEDMQFTLGDGIGLFADNNNNNNNNEDSNHHDDHFYHQYDPNRSNNLAAILKGFL